MDTRIEKTEKKSAIMLEEKIRQVKTIGIILLSMLIIGIVGFMISEKLPFNIALLRTLEAMAFIHEFNTGFAKFLSLFLSLFGAIILWWGIWSIFDFLLEGKLTEYLKELKFLNKIEKMENHYIICGGGRVGERVAEELQKRGIPYIIIEKDETIANRLKKKGLIVTLGDATEESVLTQSNLKKAKAVISVLHESEKNVIVTLTAREIAPEIIIYARADKKEFEKRLKKAGANYVLVPEILCAEKIISELFETDASKIMHQIFKEGRKKEK